MSVEVTVRSLGAARVYDALLPESMLEQALEDSRRAGFRYGWKSNPKTGFGHWNTDIVFADVENTVDREGELIANTDWPSVLGIWDFLKVALELNPVKLLRCYVNAMTYGTDGYAHVDSVRENEETLMVYLCKEWHREWAGETVIWDDEGEEIEAAITPRPGRVVMFDARRLHRANGVSRICPVARLTLMFKVGWL